MSSNHIAAQELASHKTAKDAWVAIEGKVYNVSEYLNEHPGGEEILLDVAGGDATTAFEDVGHSADAKETMETYLIGDLHGYVAPSAKYAFASKQSIKIPEPKTSSSRSIVIRIAKAASFLGATSAITIGAWSLISPSVSFPRHSGLEFGASTPYLQVLPTLIAIVSAASLGVAVVKFKKTLDLDYEIEHYKPYLKPKRTFYGPPSCRLRPTALHPTTYQKYPLIRRNQLSHNVYRFTFGLPHPSDSLELPVGRHIVIQAEVDGKMVSRSYTPVSRNEDLGVMDLVIKVYPNGAIGNYLKNLPLQQAVSIRGPAGRFRYNRFMCDRIGCIAGGSGITPMLQMIRAVCEDPLDETVISLIYANQTEEDILVKDELLQYAARYSCQFKVHFFLDRPPADWEGGVGFVKAEDIKRHLPPVMDRSKFLVCGPPPMVQAMRRNLVSLGCSEPKPVSSSSDQVYIF